MTREELLQQNIKKVKHDLSMFLTEYKNMRDAQFRERRAQGDPIICVREYNNIFYRAYLAEKSADDMFRELTKLYSI